MGDVCAYICVYGDITTSRVCKSHYGVARGPIPCQWRFRRRSGPSEAQSNTTRPNTSVLHYHTHEAAPKDRSEPRASGDLACETTLECRLDARVVQELACDAAQKDWSEPWVSSDVACKATLKD